MKLTKTHWGIIGTLATIIFATYTMVIADSERQDAKHKKFRDLAVAFYVKNQNANREELEEAANDAYFNDSEYGELETKDDETAIFSAQLKGHPDYDLVDENRDRSANRKDYFIGAFEVAYNKYRQAHHENHSTTSKEENHAADAMSKEDHSGQPGWFWSPLDKAWIHVVGTPNPTPKPAQLPSLDWVRHQLRLALARANGVPDDSYDYVEMPCQTFRLKDDGSWFAVFVVDGHPQVLRGRDYVLTD